MLENNFELDSQNHQKAAHICTLVIHELETIYNCPASVDLTQIEVCLDSLFGEDNMFLIGLFEGLFSECSFVGLDKIREKKLYHCLMVTVNDNRVFQEFIA